MVTLKEIRIFLSSNGLSGAWRALVYTFQRRRLDHPVIKAAKQAARQPFQTMGRLVQAGFNQGYAHFTFEHTVLEVCFLTPHIVRYSWGTEPPPPPYALSESFSSGKPLLSTADFTSESEGFTLSSESLAATVLRDGTLLFRNSDGLLLRHASPPLFRSSPLGTTWIESFALHEEERLYGMGEHTAPFNLRGAKLRLWNTDPAGSYGPGRDPIYMPLPILLSLQSKGGYLLFYENPFPATFEADPLDSKGNHEARATISFEGGPLRGYFIAGEPPIALERFTELVGRPPLPPRWALGYHQSRWGYRSEAEIREVATTFQRLNLPLSAIHLDIDHMRGYRVFTVDKQRFPSLPNLARDLDKQGIRLVTIVDPGVKRDPRYAVYAEGHRLGRFLHRPDGREFCGVVWPGWSAFPDFTDPETRHWWGSLYDTYLAQGIAGFWHDMNEPPSFAVDGELRLPYSLPHSLEGQGGDHRRAHNLYALQMNRAAYEYLRKAQTEQRPWLLTRSGWVSIQRYAWNWSGDIESSWEALRLSIVQVIQCGLSGQPYLGPDIGGFSGDPSAELYLRWFQTATFLPFFRTHSALTTRRREPWTYGEPYTSIIRDYLRLRYRLLPYLYTLAWQASRSGAPLVRPLLWVDPRQSSLWDVDDAFLLGDCLLIAPFLSPGQTKRALTLPEGDWYSLWDDRLFSGGGTVEVEGDLERIPVLVRAGSILPLYEDDHIHLHLYSPQEEDTRSYPSWLYTDAGDGYGEWRLDQFTPERKGETIEILHHWDGEYAAPAEEWPVTVHGATLPIRWKTQPS